MSLGNTVTYVGNKIASCFATSFSNTFYSFTNKLVEVRTARMGITKGTLHQYLRFIKISNRPTHTNL